MCNCLTIIFRGVAQSLPPIQNVQQLLRYIVSQCSLKHLLELAIKISQSNTIELLPFIRSRITKLERELATLTDTSQQHGKLAAVIKQTTRDARLTLLNLRKIYISIYRTGLYKKTCLLSVSLQKLYYRMKVLKKF